MDLKYIALVLKEYADEINNNEFDNLYENFQMKPIDQKYWWLPDQPDYDLGWFDPVKFNKWS